MYKTISILLLLLTLGACRKHDFIIDNLNNNKIVVLGHGGMGIGEAYPIDSYESISKCLSLDVDGSELDIQMTKDSVLVVFHDLELSGRTNLKGTISSLNWEEIKDARYNQHPFSSYSIITLDQLMENIKNRDDFTFTFDIKTDSIKEKSNAYCRAYANALSAVIQKYALEEKVCMETYRENLLYFLQCKSPDYKLFVYASTFETAYSIALNMNLYGITLSTKTVSKEQIKIAHDAGLRVAVWNVHSQKDNIEAIKKNPDYIQTDNIRHLIRLLK